MIMALAGLLCAAGTAKGIHLDNPRAKRISTPQLIAMAWTIICRLMAKPMALEQVLKILAREIERDAENAVLIEGSRGAAKESKAHGKGRLNGDCAKFTALQWGPARRSLSEDHMTSCG